ncbi:MAG: SBBP repeat-containing protein [Planctomycetes bacterium]|nr:SBBP repeat-containing protein [Planctomycetota bacterium]
MKAHQDNRRVSFRRKSKRTRRQRFLTDLRIERLEDRLALAADIEFADTSLLHGLAFEANLGQVASDVDFVSRGEGYSLYLEPTQASLSLFSPSGEESAGIQMHLVGGNPAAPGKGQDLKPGVSNYLIGSDPSLWTTNVPNYSAAQFDDVYVGVDIVYYGNQRLLEYDFHVEAGIDTSVIRLAFEGTDQISVDDMGDLLLTVDSGELRLHKPIAYQQVGDQRQQIGASYSIDEQQRIGFELATYDESLPLVIDPVVVYSTFLGGTNQELAYDIATDAADNAFVVGHTLSNDFPDQSALQGSHGGGFDVFVSKLDPTGTSLVWSTYLGDSGNDFGRGIALDATGNVYVTGDTDSLNFPTTPGAFQHVKVGVDTDAFVAKLDPTGSTLLYSTYIGGSSQGANARGIAADNGGLAYITGRTSAANFPVSPSAFDSSLNGLTDGFIAVINTDPVDASPADPGDPADLVYSSFIGGDIADAGDSLALDAAGTAFVTGQTNSVNAFPTTANGFKTTKTAGHNDAFLVQVDPFQSGAASLVYGTYIGGDLNEENSTAFYGGVAVHPSGDVFVAGHTRSDDFPVTPGAFDTTRDGSDAFVMRIDPTQAPASQVVYATFLGGTGADDAYDLAVDAAGNAYVTGSTDGSGTFPVTGDASQPAGAGSVDAFMAIIDPTGSQLVHGTFLGGGTDTDIGYGIALDAVGDIYVVGDAGSASFPTTAGSLQPGFAGGFRDAFITKFSGVPSGGIPNSIDPTAADQILFAPGHSTHTIAANEPNRLFQFALDFPTFEGDVTLDLAPANPASPSPAGLGLYGAGGNLLYLVDADLDVAKPGMESLEVTVQSGQRYVVGVFFGDGVVDDFELTVSADQVVNSGLTIDPGTGAATRAAAGGDDQFNSPRDVDYYPLDLTNGAESGTVTVAPQALGVAVAGTLFGRLDDGDVWQPLTTVIADPNGSPIQLPLTPFNDLSLTDAEYLLAVAPADFSAAASAYQVDVVTTLVGPATSTGFSNIDNQLTLPPVALGQASLEITNDLNGVDQRIVQFRLPPTLPADTVLTVNLTSQQFAPVVSVYDATNGDLIDIATRTAPGTVQLQLSGLSADAEYIARAATLDKGVADAEQFTLTIQSDYDPTVIALPQPTLELNSLTLGPTQGAEFLRIEPSADIDVVSVQLTPDTNGVSLIQPQVMIVGPNGPVTSGTTIFPGTPLFLAFETGGIGPFDIFVAGLSGNDPATVRIGQLDVPDTLLPGQLPSELIDLSTNQLTFNGALGGFGTSTGVEYFQLLTPPGATTTVTTTTAVDADPLTAVYAEEEGSLRLKQIALPNSPQSTLHTTALPANTLTAAVAFNIGLDPIAAASATMTVVAPVIPVPVGMVPDLKPDPALPVGEFQSILQIDPVTLEENFQRHYFSTLLPHNITGSPTVFFTRSTPDGPLQATVKIFDHNGNIIGGSNIANPGMSAIGVSGIVDNLRGRELRFVVDPAPGQFIGDGTYSLKMKVKTDEPFPFEVIEKAWRFPGKSVTVTLNDQSTVANHEDGGDCNPVNLTAPLEDDIHKVNDPNEDNYGQGGGTHIPCVGTFPSLELVKDIVQNQFGDGIATGEFTSTLPYFETPPGSFFNGSAGSIDVFRFWAAPGPVVVRTLAQPDPQAPDALPVNTALKVYRAHFDENTGEVDYLNEIEDVFGSRDWFPADRSIIDAQTYINDSDAIQYPPSPPKSSSGGGFMYYVVVKNQEASLGKYRLEIDAPNFARRVITNQTTDTVAYLDPVNGGAVNINIDDIEDYPEFVGYYTIQVPDRHDGSLAVVSALSTTQNPWDFALFNEDGLPVTGSEQDLNGQVSQTTASFNLRPGPQTAYLRVQESKVNNSEASIDVSTNLTIPFGELAPPATLPVFLFPDILPTNPFGDGSVDGTVSALNSTQAYTFPAPGGAMGVTVTPDAAADAVLQWGVYVDGELQAWEQNLTGAAATHEVTLPGSQEVVVVVKSLNTPTNGNFNLTVDSGMQSSVCDPINLDELAANPTAPPRYPYTAFPFNEPADRTASPHLQASSPTCSLAPIPTQRLMINPLTGMGEFPEQVALIVTGLDWMTLKVPQGIDGVPFLSVSPQTFTTTAQQVQLEVFNSDGELVQSTNASTNPPATSSVNFGLPNLSGSELYHVRVGTTNNATGPVLLNLSASIPKATSGKSIPDNLIPDAENRFDRLDNLGPDGQFPGGQAITFSQLASLNHSLAFWVGAAGTATFNANIGAIPGGTSSDEFLALYRADYDCAEITGCQLDLTLVDYLNETDGPSTNFLLESYVEPGLYVLESGRASGSGISGLTVSFDLPDVTPERIVLDPNFGTSYGVLQNVDRATPINATNSSSATLATNYSTRFFAAESPVGSLNGTTAFGINLSCAPADADGDALVSVWHGTNGQYSHFDSSTNLIDPPTAADDTNTVKQCDDNTENHPTNPSLAVVQPLVNGEPLHADPFDEFILAVHRNDLSTKIGVQSMFVVPISGTPDLVVETLNMLPNDGETLVVVGVRNVGYAPSSFTTAQVEFTNYNLPIEKNELPLGPFASRTQAFPWTPSEPEDHVKYTTDFAGKIDELDEGNNSIDRQLKEVDAHFPSGQITLADDALRGATPDGQWGRFVSGIPGLDTAYVFQMIDLDFDMDAKTDTDGDGIADYFQADVTFPLGTFGQTGKLTYGPDAFHQQPVSFGNLFPTVPANPNQVTMLVTDRYGLKSELLVQDIFVAPNPGWLNGSDSSITFNGDKTNNPGYDVVFHNDLINFPEPGKQTLNGLLDSTIPFIGKKKNQFLVEVNASTFVPLDPAQPLLAPASAHVLLQVLDEKVLDETYGGANQQVTDKVKLQTNLVIDSKTLDLDAAKFTALLGHFDFDGFQTPDIPLFNYGAPGVVSLQAAINLGIDFGLDAGISIMIDPGIVQDILNPPNPLGLAGPTFVQPDTTLSANIVGSLEVFGFDIASLGGGVTFNLKFTGGLDSNDVTEIIEFGDILNRSCVSLDGQFGLTMEAHVLGFEVFEVQKHFPSFNIASSCKQGILIDNNNTLVGAPAQPSNQFAALIDGLKLLANPSALLTPTVDIDMQLTGSDPVGTLVHDPHPGLVIDKPSGDAIYVQVVDANAAPNITHGNLAFAQRTGGAWSGLDQGTLAQAEHVAQPVLAETHDQATGQPVVVVYQSATVPDPVTTTANDFLTSQEIHSRYFDGTTWQTAQAVAAGEGLFDSHPTIAFNDAGVGVLTWTRNTNTTPMTTQLDRSANEIMTSVWDSSTHSWQTPLMLTNDVASDSQPTVFVNSEGFIHLVWLRDTATGNELMTSVHDGTTWSTPQVLPTIGLPAGGEIKSVALGSAGPGRIDLMLSHAVQPDPDNDPNTPAQFTLFDRASLVEDFLNPTPLEQVADGASFYDLKTLQDDGELVAYWQQADGVVNDVFVARRGATGTWSTPVPLTVSESFEFSPAVAVDTDGSYLIVYEHEAVPTVPGAPSPINQFSSTLAFNPIQSGPPVGAGVGMDVVEFLPELTFTAPMTFPNMSLAPSGAQIPAQALVSNVGLAGTEMLVEYFDETPAANSVPVATQLLQINPGQVMPLEHPFEVPFGPNTFCMRVSTADGEAFSTADNLSCADLEGIVDIVVGDVVVTGNLIAGQTVQVSAEIANPTDQPIGPFDAVLYQGDPGLAPIPALSIATVPVAGLNPFDETLVQFNWTLPSPGSAAYDGTGGPNGDGIGLGKFVLTVRADDADVIPESAEANNDGFSFVSLLPDPAAGELTTTVFDQSGVANVIVHATVHNHGQTDLTNLRVQLNQSHDNGPSQTLAAPQLIPSLAAGAETVVNFTLDVLAGDYVFQLVVDPASEHPDDNPANNVAQTHLFMPGLPDLALSNLQFDTATFIQSDPLTLSATIDNLGIADAGPFDVEVFRGNPFSGGLLIGQRSFADGLEPLSSAQVNIPLHTSQLSGQQDICIIVDRLDRLFESSDVNNVVCTETEFIPNITAEVVDGELLIHTTPLDDVIGINLTGPMIAVDFDDDGTPDVTFDPNDVDIPIFNIEVIGGAGDDLLKFDWYGEEREEEELQTRPSPVMSVEFDGGGGIDWLQFTGTRPDPLPPVFNPIDALYTPGPPVDAGTYVQTDGVFTLKVQFTSVEPIIDDISDTLTVFGTNGDNAIDYREGSTPAHGIISVDEYEFVEFTNKTTLNIFAGAGNDTVNIANAATPTDLLAITIHGDNPSTEDKVIVRGANERDSIEVQPRQEGATVMIAGLPVVDAFGFSEVEIDGAGGDDAFEVSYSTRVTQPPQTVRVLPGQAMDSGTVMVDSKTPIQFQNLGEDAYLQITSPTGSHLIHDGTPAADVFNVDIRRGRPGIGLNDRIDTLTSGVDRYTVRGMGGSDMFAVNPLDDIRVAVQGDEADDSLQVNSQGATVVNLQRNLIDDAGSLGANDVSYLGIEKLVMNSQTNDLQLRGTTNHDEFEVFDLGEGFGSAQLVGDHPGVIFHNTESFVIDGDLGADRLVVHGTAWSETITVNDLVSPPVITVGAAQVQADRIEAITVNAHEGRDVVSVNVLNDLSMKVFVDGGDPIEECGDFDIFCSIIEAEELLGDKLELVIFGSAVQGSFAGPEADEGSFQINNGESISFDHVEGIEVRHDDLNLPGVFNFGGASETDTITAGVAASGAILVALNHGVPISYAGFDSLSFDLGATTATLTPGREGAEASTFQMTGSGRFQVDPAKGTVKAGASPQFNLQGVDIIDLVGTGLSSLELPGTSGADLFQVEVTEATAMGISTAVITKGFNPQPEPPKIKTFGISNFELQGEAGFDSIEVTGDAIPGATIHSEYSPGPTIGDGQNVITVSEISSTGGPPVELGQLTINFTGFEPFFDNLPGTLTVKGTDSDNAIDVRQGSTATRGLVSVDEHETIEFENKTTLTINAAAGRDNLNLNNLNVTTDLQQINVVGGNLNDDRLTINGTPGSDVIGVTLDSADSGSALVNSMLVTFDLVESVSINGQGDGDSFEVIAPNSPSVIEFTPGASDDSGQVRVDSRVLLEFEQLGLGVVTITDPDAGNSQLIHNGYATDDGFQVPSSAFFGFVPPGSDPPPIPPSIGLNDRVPIITQGIVNYTLRGLEGNDSFGIFDGLGLSVEVEGDGPDDNDLLTFITDAAVELDLESSQFIVTGRVFPFSGIETLQLNSDGLDITGTNLDDRFEFAPLSTLRGKVHLDGYGTDIEFRVEGPVTLDGLGGADALNVVGTPEPETIVLSDLGAPKSVTVGERLPAFHEGFEAVSVDGREGVDVVRVRMFDELSIPVFVDGGNPIAQSEVCVPNLVLLGPTLPTDCTVHPLPDGHGDKLEIELVNFGALPAFAVDVLQYEGPENDSGSYQFGAGASVSYDQVEITDIFTTEVELHLNVKGLLGSGSILAVPISPDTVSISQGGVPTNITGLTSLSLEAAAVSLDQIQGFTIPVNVIGPGTGTLIVRGLEVDDDNQVSTVQWQPTGAGGVLSQLDAAGSPTDIITASGLGEFIYDARGGNLKVLGSGQSDVSRDSVRMADQPEVRFFNTALILEGTGAQDSITFQGGKDLDATHSSSSTPGEGTVSFNSHITYSGIEAFLSFEGFNSLTVPALDGQSVRVTPTGRLSDRKITGLGLPVSLIDTGFVFFQGTGDLAFELGLGNYGVRVAGNPLLGRDQLSRNGATWVEWSPGVRMQIDAEVGTNEVQVDVLTLNSAEIDVLGGLDDKLVVNAASLVGQQFDVTSGSVNVTVTPRDMSRDPATVNGAGVGGVEIRSALGPDLFNVELTDDMPPIVIVDPNDGYGDRATFDAFFDVSTEVEIVTLPIGHIIQRQGRDQLPFLALLPSQIGITLPPKANQPPTANNDLATTDEDIGVSIVVLDNDTDPDGDPLSPSITILPTHGTAVVEPGGTIKYTPTPNFHGVDSFNYKANDGTVDSVEVSVSVTVNPVNDAPVANDDSTMTGQDVPVVIDVLVNDTDLEEASLRISQFSSINGTAIIDDNGTPTVTADDQIRFVPTLGFSGIATITYQVTDGNLFSNKALVKVTVNATDPDPIPPTADAGGPYTVNEGSFVTLFGSASTGNAPLTYAWDLDADGQYDDANGSTPTFNALSLDGPSTHSVSLQVTDGGSLSAIATTTVNVLNVAPIADAGGPYLAINGTALLAASASDPANQVVSNDSLTFRWDFDGDGEFDDAIGRTTIFTATGDEKSFIVAVRTDDDDGGVSPPAWTTITALNQGVSSSNQPPDIHYIEAPVQVDVDAPSDVRVVFTDPDSGESPPTVAFDWGDGTPLETATVSFDRGFWTAIAGHTYQQEDEYVIRVTVIDEGGAAATASHRISVTDLSDVLRQLDLTHGYQFPGNHFDNWGNRGEKWIQDALQKWHFITPDGRLFRWDQSNTATGDVIAFLAPSVYEDPSLLYEAAIEAEGEGLDSSPPLAKRIGVWTNGRNVLDVSSDGNVTPLDALIVINKLNRLLLTGGSGKLPSQPVPSYYYDVSNDGSVSPLDALQIINHLNSPAARLSVDAEGDTFGGLQPSATQEPGGTLLPSRQSPVMPDSDASDAYFADTTKRSEYTTDLTLALPRANDIGLEEYLAEVE